MVFIMRVSGSSRGFFCRLFCAVLLGLLPFCGYADDFAAEVTQAEITSQGNHYVLSADIIYNLSEKAKDALPLMKHLKVLKNKYNLSILALAHTPKRDLTKPITRNDLQGSKMLINFCSKEL